MFSEPRRAEYSSYDAFVLASLGYAGCLQGFGLATPLVTPGRLGGVALCGNCGVEQGSLAWSLATGKISVGDVSSRGEVADRGGDDLRIRSGNSCVSGVGVDSGDVPVSSFRDSEREGASSGLRGDLKDEIQSVDKEVVDNKVQVDTKTERNRRWRRERRELKIRRKLNSKDWRSGSSQSGVTEASVRLRTSLEHKWQTENELASAKASRALVLLQAGDVDNEIKRQRTRVSMGIEKNMVAMERAHSSLTASGNVPGQFHGSAKTVVGGNTGEPSLTSGSISPNSSASMAEFRAQQKLNLDLEAKNAEWERKFEKLSERFGVECTYIDYFDKGTWTDTSENHHILDGIMPDGYGMDRQFAPEGKFHVS